MNLYRVIYTICLDVEAMDSTKALDIAAETALEDFYFCDAEVEAIPRD